MRKIELTLSTGTWTVCAVPAYLLEDVLSAVPLPEVPQRPAENTPPGVDLTIPDPDDPAYVLARDKALTERARLYNRAQLYYAFREVDVPDDWPGETQVEEWAKLGLNVQIPTDGVGRKVAYVRRAIFGCDADRALFDVAMTVLNEPTEEERASVRGLFRRSLQGQSD